MDMTHITANMMYVLYLIELKDTGVIMTTKKLKIQLADVDRALAGARIRRGTCDKIKSASVDGNSHRFHVQSRPDTATSCPANPRQRRC